eukprot:m.242839 g.242839  ORF g.242839 m.242839 type:complete len:462 (+) comp19014_c0_seq1:1452-2837(+)
MLGGRLSRASPLGTSQKQPLYLCTVCHRAPIPHVDNVEVCGSLPVNLGTERQPASRTVHLISLCTCTCTMAAADALDPALVAAAADEAKQLEVKRLRGDLKSIKADLRRLNKEVRALQRYHAQAFDRMQNLLVMHTERHAAGPGTAVDALAAQEALLAPTCRTGAISNVWGPQPQLAWHAPIRPIGHIDSIFVQKTGTPRQGTVCPYSKARLRVTCFQNPEHAIQGLEEFSHVWLVFVFHLNGHDAVKAKVNPPRLDGTRKLGVFATRTPHRPNPIGLTLAKLEGVEGDTLLLSNLDLVSGTPVLDVKPYIHGYDSCSAAKTASWVSKAVVRTLDVAFTPECHAKLQKFAPEFKFFKTADEAEQAICDILRADPRSVYRRHQGPKAQFCWSLDVLNMKCDFDDDNRTVTVVKLELIDKVPEGVKFSTVPAPRPWNAQEQSDNGRGDQAEQQGQRSVRTSLV